jgi:DNA-directed RNA polymerase subunit RPC12/RpoP
MSQETVRCPYCVLGSDFRPMFRKSSKSFVCVGCGHLSSPEDTHLRCPCQRCAQMNRVAKGISRERPGVSSINS